MFSALLLSFLLISTTLTTNKSEGNENKLTTLIKINRIKTKFLKQRIRKTKTHKPAAIKCSYVNYSPDIYGLSLKNEENFDASKYLNK